jgi:hypothetical protein
MFGKDPAVLAANTPNAMVAKATGKRIQLIESTTESDTLIKGQAADFGGRLRGCQCAASVDVRLDSGNHDVDFVGVETPNLVAFLDAGWQGSVTPQPQPPGPVSAPPIMVKQCDDVRRARDLGYRPPTDARACAGRPEPS